MAHVLIIGAGLSGLTAAYALSRSEAFAQSVAAGTSSLRVLEASPHAGGLIRSRQEQGFLTEDGPHTFPSTARELVDLAQQLDLTPMPTSQAAKKRYLYLNGRLIALPSNLWEAVTTPILSPGGKVRLLQEPFLPKTEQADISIADFFQRRLGVELTAHLVDPFISGIYAGDIQSLSLPAVFPKVWEWEQSSGSIIKGMLQARKKASAKEAPFSEKRAEKKARMHLLSFEGGLQTLTDALVRALPPHTLSLNHSVDSIQAVESGYRVQLQTGELLEVTHLILALPAYRAARLLRSVIPMAAEPLADISYNALAMVQTGFKQSDIPHALDGFGCLLPRREQLPLLGTIWASSLFPERAPTGHVLFSNYIGGAHRPELVEWEPERILTEVLNNLAIVFKTKPLEPSFHRVMRYQQAIPQYTLGHRQRIAQTEQALAKHSRVALCGNYLHGVALNECVKSGLGAAERIAASL